AAWIAADSSTFNLITGESDFTRYETETGSRCFCSICGSPLWSEIKEFPELLGVPYGILDERDLPEPELQVWVQSKVPWCDIAEDLPSYDTTPGEDT
ncbi:MAG: GFA family protein, partial [Pseudomonadales bacterium]|nr:GFA family protein [Pseudomonadales bacterium]